jgi:Prokaryotic RING finger family 1
VGTLFFEALAVLAVAGGYSYWKRIGQNELYLRQICSGFLFGHPKKLPTQSNEPSRWRIYSYEGIFQDRRVIAGYRFRSDWKGADFEDELEIRIPIIQKFWLRMLPQNTEENEEGEIILDQQSFDRAFRIYANQEEAATEFLQSRIIQERLQMLPLPMDRLEIYHGWLTALFLRPRERRMMRSDFESILEHLILVTVAYERQSYRLEIRKATPSGLCPYCRGKMEQNEAIVECVQCCTQLHQACWEENKQCTTWGCNSTEAKRTD